MEMYSEMTNREELNLEMYSEMTNREELNLPTTGG